MKAIELSIKCGIDPLPRLPVDTREQQNSNRAARVLRVPFYSVFHEKATFGMSNGGRLGGLKSAAKRKQQTENCERPKFFKNGKPRYFGSPCGAPSGDDKTVATVAQSADCKEKTEKATAAEMATPLARGLASKERKYFLSENTYKGGGSSEDTPPALKEEKTAPLSANKSWREIRENNAEITDVVTGVITDVTTNVTTNVTTDVTTGVATKKERKYFLSENTTKGGGSSEDTPPALWEEKTAPLGAEEIRSALDEMRALSAMQKLRQNPMPPVTHSVNYAVMASECPVAAFYRSDGIGYHPEHKRGLQGK